MEKIKLVTVRLGKSGTSNTGYEYMWMKVEGECFSQIEIFHNDYIVCSFYIQEHITVKWLDDVRDTLQIFGFRI